MRSYRSRSLVIGSAASLLALGWMGPAAADGGDDGHGGNHDVLRIASLDDCEPESFNAAFGEGICVKDGDTTVDEFLAQLEEEGEVDGWEFDPDEAEIDRGTAIVVKGIGGEFHTFTEVEEFGGGCIPELNEGLEPVPECDDPSLFETTGVGPDEKLRVTGLKPGEHLFMCLIHPWMTAEIEVERRDHGHH
jgi:plastocyanin